jgi:hypothetical protein
MGVILLNREEKRVAISLSESFSIIVGGKILIFGSFVLYAVFHHDKHQKHPR